MQNFILKILVGAGVGCGMAYGGTEKATDCHKLLVTTFGANNSLTASLSQDGSIMRYYRDAFHFEPPENRIPVPHVENKKIFLGSFNAPQSLSGVIHRSGKNGFFAVTDISGNLKLVLPSGSITPIALPNGHLARQAALFRRPLADSQRMWFKTAGGKGKTLPPGINSSLINTAAFNLYVLINNQLLHSTLIPVPVPETTQQRNLGYHIHRAPAATPLEKISETPADPIIDFDKHPEDLYWIPLQKRKWWLQIRPFKTLDLPKAPSAAGWDFLHVLSDDRILLGSELIDCEALRAAAQKKKGAAIDVTKLTQAQVIIYNLKTRVLEQKLNFLEPTYLSSLTGFTFHGYTSVYALDAARSTLYRWDNESSNALFRPMPQKLDGGRVHPISISAAGEPVPHQNLLRYDAEGYFTQFVYHGDDTSEGSLENDNLNVGMIRLVALGDDKRLYGLTFDLTKQEPTTEDTAWVPLEIDPHESP